MAHSMSIVVTSGVAATEVEEENAKDFAEAYAALRDLPVNRAVVVDFPESDYKPSGKPGQKTYKTALDVAAAAAREYVRQGKAWAAHQTGPNGRALTFARKGDIKGQPNRVTFRIYEPRESETETTESE